MKDMQNSQDSRGVSINRVGVKDIKVPINLMQKDSAETQQTPASFNMYVNLPHEFKGTHMSRFGQLLNEQIIENRFSIDVLNDVFDIMLNKLDAETGYIECSFNYFIIKHAPVSKEKGFNHYPCTFIIKNEDGRKMMMRIKIPLTTLCPCSKEISEAGAHNQRGWVTVTFDMRDVVWIEDIIDTVESCGSCEIYSVLKRPDEKYVTEKAYKNPRFVEDMVREVYLKLKDINKIQNIKVECENEESIHLHNAYAMVRDY